MMSTLTPSAMLELPRPSAALMSPSGIRFAQSTSKYDFRTRLNVKQVYCASIATSGHNSETPTVLLQDVKYTELGWADDETLLFLRVHPESVPTAQDAKSSEASYLELWGIHVSSKKEYKLGHLPIDEAADVKIHHISPDSAVLAFSARVYGPDRSIYNAQKRAQEVHQAKQGSDVMVYDKLFIRHWDTFLDSSIKQVHVLFLNKEENGQWSFDDKAILSPMSDTTLECPVGPFGGSSDFDISATHIAFTAKDPHLPPAWHTRQHIYTVPFKPRSAEDAKPKQLTGSIGATSSPVFSPEHKHAAAQGATHVHGALAWLEMREDGYEADRNRVMVHDLKSGQTKGVTEEWDCSPASIAWSEDAHQLFLVAEQVARVKAFRLKLKGSEDPVALTSQGSISSLSVIPTPVTQPTNKPPPTRLLLSSTSHVSPTVVSLAIVEDEGEVKQHVLSSLAKPYLDKLDPPLRRGQDFWFDGAKTKVHGWIIYPPTMQGAPDSEQEKAQWPLAFLIHGGPQGSWADSWSTRWNPSVFASRGYITVAIDPTGSTGYGQEFCDAIKGEWGGLPYQDLVAGYQHILKTCPAIDSTRTAALGASYGGYMINWIQGHNPGFKALVCHDGVFDTEAAWYETEELYFAERENKYNTPWEDPAMYAKWNPKNHVASFKTPQLIIHGGKDYRLPETQGIGPFNALQRRGIPSRFVYFPKENHWVLSQPNSLRWHEEVFKWLQEWVGK